jgi:protein-S-isoprenylcysteine O-methyltransferase Ste14
MTDADRPAAPAANPGPGEKRMLRRRAVLLALSQPLVMGFTLFVPAGTLAWPAAWALLAVYDGGMLLTNLWLTAHHPGLARERLIVPRSSERWDLRIIQITNVLLLAVMLPLAGLDHRLGASPALPASVTFSALILFAAMFLCMAWAMSVNEYFSAAVRLQADRGQTVACRGPYRAVRHPGYVAMIVQFLAIPVALGSLWALIPAAAIAAAYVYRTRREDDFLMRALPEYKEYASGVPYRLIPGIW